MNDNESGQVQVIEAIIVGILVFVAIAIAAVFRVPTISSTFEQSELERLGSDVLIHLAAAGPKSAADCNEGPPCPFQTELERMVSLALRYQGPTIVGTHETRDVSPMTDYLNQSLPEGARYIISYSNGVNATRLFPPTLVAPALDVVVSHTLIAPNWTAYSTKASTSVMIQLDEITGFKTANVALIRDPLNRIGDEWRVSDYKTAMSNAAGKQRMPISAVLGTYQFCAAADCAAATTTYFTVVPPGIYGPGSSILLADRDNSTSLQPVGGSVASAGLFSWLKFTDHVTNNGELEAEERLYLDFNNPGSNTVSAGDLRLSDCEKVALPSVPRCIAGSFVRAGDFDTTNNPALEAFPLAYQPNIRSISADNAFLEEGEYVYLNAVTAAQPTGNSVVDALDRRLTRVATYRFGSEVDTGSDAGLALNAATDYTGANLYYGDVDGDGALDTDEPIYLDLVGFGQDPGIESLDLRLSPRGSPNLRYAYDIQAVIWFGI